MKIKIKHPPLKPETFPELKSLSEQIGEFMEYWGFKRVHGRLWTYLYLAGDSLNTQQLMELLGISKALVSQTLSDLLEYRVIEELGRGQNGVISYRANPNVGEVIAGVLKAREKKMLQKIEATHKSMKRAPSMKKNSLFPIHAERFKLLGEWVTLAQSLLDAGVALAGTSEDPFSNPESLLKAVTAGDP